jgi:hypothetical protein
MAEVKVRITAQNETQTGFQAALTNAKKFGAEASRAASVSIPTPAAAQRQAAGSSIPAPQMANDGFTDFKSFYEDASKKAEAAIEANLAKRKAAREAAAQAEKAANADSESSIMSLVGRFAILAGAATLVGKAISAGFERIAAAFQSAAQQSKQFASALQSAGTANSLSGAISGFKTLNEITDQTKATLDELQGKSMGSAVANALQGNPGQLFARSASLVGFPGANDLQDQIQEQRQMAREALIGSLGRQASNGEELLGAGGKTEEIKKIAQSQANAREIEELRQALELRKESNEYIEQAIALKQREQAASAAVTEQIRQRVAQEKQAQARGNAMQAAQEQAMANQVAGMTPEDRLAFNKQGLQDLEGFVGPEVDRQRLEIRGEIAQLEKAITAENERQAAAVIATASRAQAMREANAETAATQGMTDSELLARQQAKLAALDQGAMESGRYSNEDQIEREAILQNILGLEERIKRTREAAQKSLGDAIADREFAGMSPAEQQAQIARDQATLLSDIEGGNITDAEAAQRAMELARRQDSLANGGLQGSAGASSLQRIGLASNEFFDSRSKKDPSTVIEKGNRILEDIKKALNTAEPLVLNPNS